MSETKENTTAAWIMLISLSIVWGFSFLLIKRGLVIFSPDEVGAIRITCAGLVFMPMALPRLRKLSGRQLKLLLLTGTIGSLIPAFLFAKAETGLASSLTGVLNALTPLFTIIIGFLFFSTKVKRHSIIGIIVGFLGSIGLSLVNSDGKLGEINYFAIYVVIATVCYAANINMVKNYFSKLSPIEITSISLFFVGMIAAVYLLGFTDTIDKLQHTEGAWTAFGYVAFLGVTGTSLALFFFNRLVQISTPVFSSSATYLIPIVAVIVGVLDGEVLVAGHYIFMLVMILGVYIANRKK